MKKKVYKVLRDKSASFKRLKKLQSMGLIELYDLDFEDNVPPSKMSVKLYPMEGVLDETAVLPFRLPTQEEADRYEAARKLIGKGGKQHRDAITIEAADRHDMDYFVTEDKDDFIKERRRGALEKIFTKVKIVTPEELEAFLGIKN